MRGSFVAGGLENHLQALRQNQSQRIASYKKRIKDSRDSRERRWLGKRLRVIERRYRRQTSEAGRYWF